MIYSTRWGACFLATLIAYCVFPKSRYILIASSGFLALMYADYAFVYSLFSIKFLAWLIKIPSLAWGSYWPATCKAEWKSPIFSYILIASKAFPALINSPSASLYRFSSYNLKACFKWTSLILCFAWRFAILKASSN